MKPETTIALQQRAANFLLISTTTSRISQSAGHRTADGSHTFHAQHCKVESI